MDRKLGWKPDLPDFRDYQADGPTWTETVTLSRYLASYLSKDVDLRDKMPPIYDQGQTGSCVENSILAAFDYEHVAQGLKSLAPCPSRLFVYYNVRVMEGTVNEDAGSSIRNAMKAVAKLGVPPETTWPFNPSLLTKKPPPTAYQEALGHTLVRYTSVPVAEKNILSCLSHNIPVVFGVTVYESFMSNEVAKTGVVPMPKTTEKFMGGHAMLVVGFKLSERQFIVRNSWGTGWGDKGYCYMPFDYIANPYLGADYWMVQLVK